LSVGVFDKILGPNNVAGTTKHFHLRGRTNINVTKLD